MADWHPLKDDDRLWYIPISYAEGDDMDEKTKPETKEAAAKKRPVEPSCPDREPRP